MDYPTFRRPALEVTSIPTVIQTGIGHKMPGRRRVLSSSLSFKSSKGMRRGDTCLTGPCPKQSKA